MVHKPVQANVIIAQTCEKSTWRRASKCHQSRKMQLSHHARTPSRANTSQAYERKPSNFGDNWYMLSKKRRTITRLRCAHWQVGACRFVDLQMHQMPQSQSNAPAQRDTIPSRSVLEQVQTGAIFHFTHRRRSQPRSRCEHKPHHTSSVSHTTLQAT